MADRYNVRLYYDTGFDRGNVPGNPELLDTADHVDFNSIFQRQDLYLATIKLDAEWEQVRGADYARIMTDESSTPTYYVVDGVQMLTPRTAQLTLVLDPLLSCGGVDSIRVAGGWVVRSHVGSGEDDLFSNILPEPWQPSNELKIIDIEEVHTKPIDSGNIELVNSTVDLSGMSEYTATVLTAASDPDSSITIPSLPALETDQFTTVSCLDEEYTLPSLATYRLRASGVSEALSLARQIGVDSAIMGSYVIPLQDVTYTTTTGGLITKLEGTTTTYSPGQKFKYSPTGTGHTIQNNKTYALYQSFRVQSVSSGNLLEFKAQNLYNQDSPSSAPTWVVFSDPSPNGTVYCKPTWFEGYTSAKTQNSVAGMPWLSTGLLLQGASGGALSVMNAYRQNNQINNSLEWSYTNQDISAITNFTSSVLSAVGNLSTLTNGLTNGMTNYMTNSSSNATNTSDIMKTTSGISGFVSNIAFGPIQAEAANMQNYDTARYQMGDNMFSAIQSGYITAPTVVSPVSVNMSSYFGNSFLITQIGLAPNDMVRLDRFFTLYGYSQDKELEISDLNNRTVYNYIKTNGATYLTKYGTGNKTLMDAIGTMTDNGVRIWHTTMPSKSGFDITNPPKSN